MRPKLLSRPRRGSRGLLRRLVFAISVAACVVAVSAGFGGAQTQSGGYDFVSGAGTVHVAGTLRFEVIIDAHNVPGGPVGHLTEIVVDTATGSVVATWMGKVECLEVSGNEATVAAVRHHATGLFVANETLRITVIDGGPPQGGEPPDTQGGAFDQPTDCTVPQGTGPIEQGNYIVRDAES